MLLFKVWNILGARSARLVCGNVHKSQQSTVSHRWRRSRFDIVWTWTSCVAMHSPGEGGVLRQVNHATLARLLDLQERLMKCFSRHVSFACNTVISWALYADINWLELIENLWENLRLIRLKTLLEMLGTAPFFVAVKGQITGFICIKMLFEHNYWSKKVLKEFIQLLIMHFAIIGTVSNPAKNSNSR